ncbi:hypothetical protein AMAG_14152 [Allomyces macrogynus ATCC 38327]|uniref:Uncharacterized protein n=1 Tax=Allomyces macrogynus (strain ATCC 38327) TaxID=578462 RepID=A0A0L0T4D7_ALLM3|nr:hypothetical protein AMAG_14152 [Allomyces macrogynus ATCC 38327]|eukprot:KNE69597.1 hypothetical protein AMAG_14152 [Allomyces macrogynus ATCC 38327]
MFAELQRAFKLTLMRHDWPTLIRRVALPLVECFLLTKSLDPTWDFQSVLLGKPFSSQSMVDPPLEVEWREGERGAPARGAGLLETKVVLLTTFPGIPFRFGVAETFLHRAEVLVVPLDLPAPAPAPGPTPRATAPALTDLVQKENQRALPVDLVLEPLVSVCARARTPTPPALPSLVPAMEPAIAAGQSTNPTLVPIPLDVPVVPKLASAPAMMTASVQTDAAEVFLTRRPLSYLLAGELAALSANLNEIIRAPVLLNQPPGLKTSSSHWPRVHATADIITRFLDAFHRIASDPRTDLHHELNKVDNRLALLRAGMPLATYEGRDSDRLRTFIATHSGDLHTLLGPLYRVSRRPHWVVPFLHNLYQWFRLVLTARLAGYELVMPCTGEPHRGQITCLAHEHTRDCGDEVGVALGPNLVRITDGLPACNVAPCPGYCDRAVPN